MQYGRHIILLVLLFCCLQSRTQKAPFNFHHLTVNDGLNDGIINAIVQDKYGYMWFASYGALNRYNGSSIRKFLHTENDTTSPPGGISYAMFCSSEGRLWIGYDDGLVEYNYAADHFQLQQSTKKLRINSITEIGKTQLLLLTAKGAFVYSTTEKKLSPFTAANNKELFKQHYPLSLYKKGKQLLMGSYGGYILYDLESRQATFHTVPVFAGLGADRVMMDERGDIWLSNVFNFKLLKVTPSTDTVVAIDQLPSIRELKVQMSFLNFVADANHNVWIVTSLKGLIQYNIVSGELRFHQHQPFVPGSIAVNILRTIYKAPDGNIWISMLGGVDYFNPSQTLFSVVYPFPNADANLLARGFSEDDDGNYWFTTGDGISQYNTSTKKYKVWRNETGKPDQLYYNSVRAVLADSDVVWIATGKGVNRYNRITGKMEFLTSKDSLPQGFYLNINKDKSGNVWFGTNQNDGLYYYAVADKKIHSIATHPVLKKYKGYSIRTVFEDSKQRLWIGFGGEGVAMYDPQQQTTREWIFGKKEEKNSNANLTIDIKEDKKGVIWISSFHGLRGIDLQQKQEYWFTAKDGLRSNLVMGIAVDARDRLWLSSSAGLMMFDSSRKFFSYFDESFGLPAMEFPEHPAHVTRDGRMVFPSVKGYIFFDPLNYTEGKKAAQTYVASVEVFGKPFHTTQNFAECKSLHFHSNENFFTLELESLNYDNPGQAWYAYKLDGLEKEWHYTQDPKAVYTNVPGGSYTFRFKSTINANNWNTEEKSILIKVDTVFYKATWFWLLIAAAVAGLLYGFYRYRIRQQEQLHNLQSKAQLLEKEKALVMYESLKQQLNPHFLFNSLTSLNSLIQGADKKTAAGFLDSLSKTYRYILKSRDSETVSLIDELKFAENYVKLQRIRFEKGFDVLFHVPEEYHHRKIVPVTLQNLIENAIKHNIIDEDTPLKVEIVVEDDSIVVRNNLQKKKFVETSNKQGLANLQSLYMYLSNRPVEIKETNSTFTISIPLL
ncbi:hypothetical protein ESA94_15365 [Lacibacter luteus]|uniref:Histidine kinase n=1 Tax=Lacibacter luteus TaxID=2508719 RepID=A0A4Q1CFU2_9BACT|nr:sensor histidine kinase [Lacibacter luteus]RXK58767.1 hypothetical protein ESA94_15365 [Lacibacter luteus]